MTITSANPNDWPVRRDVREDRPGAPLNPLIKHGLAPSPPRRTARLSAPQPGGWPCREGAG